MKILRFLNLLEPGIAVISVSKLLCWLATGFMVYTLMYHPQNMIAVLSAVGGFTTTMLNFGYRRWMFARNRKEN